MNEGLSPERREWMAVDVATVLEAPPDLTAGGEVAAPAAATESSTPRWLPSPETVVWTWPRLDERIVEELE